MSLRREIDRIIERLGCLPVRLRGVYFACCGERLLPVYREFATRFHWGDPERIAAALDGFWAHVDGEAPGVDDWIRQIETQTPAADDFDNLWATFAQDACICVDVALRAFRAAADVSPNCAWYPWETVRLAVTHSVTGIMDFGSGPEADAWDREILRDPRTAREMEYQTQLLASLEQSPGAGVLCDLRSVARAQAWSGAALLTPPRA